MWISVPWNFKIGSWIHGSVSVSFRVRSLWCIRVYEHWKPRSQLRRWSGQLCGFLQSRLSTQRRPALSIELPSKVKLDVDRIRGKTVRRLWQVTEQMNILYPENWTRIASEEILAFQQVLTQALTRQFMEQRKYLQSQTVIQTSEEETPMAEPQATAHMKWTFARGLLYSVSLLTTIGKCVACGVFAGVWNLKRGWLAVKSPRGLRFREKKLLHIQRVGLDSRNIRMWTSFPLGARDRLPTSRLTLF